MAWKTKRTSAKTEVRAALVRYVNQAFRATGRDYLENASEIPDDYLQSVVEQITRGIEGAFEPYMVRQPWGTTQYYNPYAKDPANVVRETEPRFSRTYLKFNYQSDIGIRGGVPTLLLKVIVTVVDDEDNPHPLWHWLNFGVEKTLFRDKTPKFVHRGVSGPGPRGQYADNTGHFKEGQVRQAIPGRFWTDDIITQIPDFLPDGWRLRDVKANNPLRKK